MKQLFKGKPLDIILYPGGFVLVLTARDPLSGTRKPLFKFFDLNHGKVRDIEKDDYLNAKFGPAYDEITSQIKDYVSCAVTSYKNKLIHVVYPTGELGTFDYTGTLIWTGDLTYHDSPVRSCAVDGKFIWCAVPDQNAVVRYSPKLERVDFRIGGINTTAFGRPMAVTIYDDNLYVCNKTSNNLKIVSLDNFVVTDYRNFEEPVLRYLQFKNKEIVVLSSGVYIL